MTDEPRTTDIDTDTAGADALRTETASASPEVAEHDALATLRAEVEELRQRALYAQAETQNVRRRLEKEKQDAASYAASGFARDILSVSDNLTRALAAMPEAMKADESMKALVTGIEATGKELESVLGRHGITRIAAVGERLDPHRHQAMVEIPSANVEPGVIVQEMQAGYMMKDRLLRPALVGVAKAG